MTNIANSILDFIGNTPLLKVNGIDTGPCELFLKLELRNPGDSIKDRIAQAMIKNAEDKGLLKPGGLIVEGTAGNTGIALAMIGRLKGYKVTVVLPDKMSAGKIAHLKALGAKVVLASSQANKGDSDYYQDMAENIAKKQNGYFINQFGNPSNPEIHEKTTGPEIWNQCNENIDAFIAGVGSGGTITGVGRYLKKMNPSTQIILADPVGSIVTEATKGNIISPTQSWHVEGVGEDFIPSILDLNIIDEAIQISDKRSFEVVEELLLNEGLLVGSSSGTLIGAALEWCRKQETPKRAVTFACDSGAKYMEKLFNRSWKKRHNIKTDHTYGDLRDSLSKRIIDNELPTLKKSQLMSQALSVMSREELDYIAITDMNENYLGHLSPRSFTNANFKKSNLNETIENFVENKLPKISRESSLDEAISLLEIHPAIAIIGPNDNFDGFLRPFDTLPII